MFPDLILELIYQHFVWFDIKNTSEVSSSWNESVGNSKTCMDRIKIDLNKIFGPHTKEPPTREAIHRSSRKYRNVWAACHNQTRTSGEVYELMKKFESSIVSLTAISINLESSFVSDPLAMPHLKSLQVTNLSPKACELILSQEQSIEYLLLRPINEPQFMANVLKFLKTQSSLEELVLMRDEQFTFFANLNEPVNFPFKLKRLVIQRHCRRAVQELNKVVANFNSFVTSQKDFIEIVDIDFLPSTKNLEILYNEMPNLKSLKIKSCLTNQVELQLKKNSSINELSVGGLSLDVLKSFITATLNLNTLILKDDKLTKDLLEFIVSNHMSLKKLIFMEIDNGCVLHYKEIIKSRNNVNKDVEIVWLLTSETL